MATDVVVIIDVVEIGEMALVKEPVIVGLAEEQIEVEVRVL